MNGSLAWRPRRPVYEAAVTYEPGTGVIEVVAGDRDSREDLVRLFAEHLLGVCAEAQKLPLRQFDLDAL
ncbi:MAG TPA: hypothetical protein VH230_00075, partial [Stellaceae bacterium]|nr:hypothetical protein [Stellaceae bacterium]